MANHGFMTTRKFMKVEDIDSHLRAFMEKRFPGIDYEIEGPFDMDPELGGWLIRFFNEPHEAFQVWLTSRRKLEFRHPLGPRVPYWAQALFQHEMGKLYEGRISDDGYEGFSKPSPDDMGTFKKYVDIMTRIVPAIYRPLHRRLYYDNVDERYSTIPDFK